MYDGTITIRSFCHSPPVHRFVLAILLMLTFVIVSLAVRKIGIFVVWFNLIPLALFFVNAGFVKCSDLFVRAISMVSFVIGVLMIVVGVITILAIAVYLAMSKSGR
jgi:hypothetical protein